MAGTTPGRDENARHFQAARPSLDRCCCSACRSVISGVRLNKSGPDCHSRDEPFSNVGNRAAGILEMTITIYGIKNCDTMKKARAWLDSHGVAYGFHDYKTEGIAREKLKRWSEELGWETLLNRAGTTFRKLPDSDREGLDDRKA